MGKFGENLIILNKLLISSKCFSLSLFYLSLLFLSIVNVQASPDQDELIKQGQYIVTVAGCNDCHTLNYARKAGRIDFEDWLTGSDIGFKGPWGVTYAANLRLYFSGLTEDQWITKAKEFKTRPPMPWFVIRQMRETDLRAIYLFITSLGKMGSPAPDYTPRGEPAKTSFINFMPQSEPVVDLESDADE